MTSAESCAAETRNGRVPLDRIPLGALASEHRALVEAFEDNRDGYMAVAFVCSRIDSLNAQLAGLQIRNAIFELLPPEGRARLKHDMGLAAVLLDHFVKTEAEEAAAEIAGATREYVATRTSQPDARSDRQRA